MVYVLSRWLISVALLTHEEGPRCKTVHESVRSVFPLSVAEMSSQITDLRAKVAKLTDLTEQLQSEAARAGADL